MFKGEVYQGPHMFKGAVYQDPNLVNPIKSGIGI